MDRIENINRRLSVVEDEIARLKREVEQRTVTNGATWVDQRSGSFAGDDEFREILRLGQESRKASLEAPETPGTTRRKRSKS